MKTNDDKVLLLNSPTQTSGWVSSRDKGFEVFTTPEGLEYTRCTDAEQPDVVVTFTKILGLNEVRLKLIGASKVAKRHRKKQRKEERVAKERAENR